MLIETESKILDIDMYPNSISFEIWSKGAHNSLNGAKSLAHIHITKEQCKELIDKLSDLLKQKDK
jgi:hypothetical protein